jgi:hypothetical protein
VDKKEYEKIVQVMDDEEKRVARALEAIGYEAVSVTFRLKNPEYPSHISIMARMKPEN